MMKKLICCCWLISCSYLLSANSLYLDLTKKCLLNLIYENKKNLAQIEAGKIWPSNAHTMIGLVGLDNIQQCMEDILKNNIPGDAIETGVWRGGACIFMRAVLKAYNVTDRTVWVADSFEGLPVPNKEKYPLDSDFTAANKILAQSLNTVKENFSRYGLLDNQVQFLKGWFKDTLPQAPIKKLSLLRLDGDYYESTMDALVHLYPKLSIGGYIIIDDYCAMSVCAKAVDDYRKTHGITDQIEAAGWSIRYWKKTK
jgi:hypothetical protein